MKLKPRFSYIYLERQLAGSEEAEKVLQHFPDSRVIEIDHYKDVFNRHHQSDSIQHRSQSLILAERRGKRVFPGAPVCQSFGNKHFYYMSVAMNCIYDCEYCYLRGMYPSGDLVLFLNLPDYFEDLRELLQQHPVYCCISYDTDLAALESVYPFVRTFTEFTESERDLTIEVRTKRGNAGFLDGLTPSERVIFAVTMSPSEIAERFEMGAGSLDARIRTACEILKAGFPLRLCFDPMIFVPGWKGQYREMIDQIFREIDPSSLLDVSVGSFRISEAYLKKLRKQYPCSGILQFPFQNEAGYYHYPDALTEEMEGFLTECLRQCLPEEKIFRWKES